MMMIEMRLVKRHRVSGQEFAPPNALSLFNGGFAILECREVGDFGKVEPGSARYVSAWVETLLTVPLAEPAPAEDFKLEESATVSKDTIAAMRPLPSREVSGNLINFQSLTMAEYSGGQVLLTRSDAPQGVLVDKLLISKWLLKVIENAYRDSDNAKM